MRTRLPQVRTKQTLMALAPTHPTLTFHTLSFLCLWFAEEPEHKEGATGINVEIDRAMKKMPNRMKALMSRFGGHPYDTYDKLPNYIVDPTIPLEENIERMGRDYNWVPPELDPQIYPELLLQGSEGPLAQFEHQQRMEALILGNLDAAIKDRPKPTQFVPTAGTVPCPECLGKPYFISFAPNVAKLFHVETPFWMRTLSRMNELGTAQSVLEASQSRPWITSPSISVEQSRLGESSSTVREVPRSLPGDYIIQKALESSGNAWHYPAATSTSALGYDEDPLSLASQAHDLDVGVNPITGGGPAEALAVYYALNPARNAARKIREERRKAREQASVEVQR